MKFTIPKNFFKNKTIFITGGTGSFGKNMVNHLLKNYKNLQKIIIYSRDELKQFEMANNFSLKENEKLRFFIGDVRDGHRLKTAMENVDYVFHAAALKQVPSSEYNPFETIKTNIIGSQNVIESALENNVNKVLALSTDKASSPYNLYGATKLCADKLFIAANNVRGKRKISFSVLRYGNVFGSRGSVVETFAKSKKRNIFNIADKRMTRFNITIEEAIERALYALYISQGEEIIVPKLPSYRILDLVEAIRPNAKINITGIRPGEKLNEELISINNAPNTVEIKNFYIILNYKSGNTAKYYKNKHNSKIVKDFFSYTSDRNESFLSVNQIKKLL